MKKKVEVVEVNLVQAGNVTQFDLRFEEAITKKVLRPWVKKAVVGIAIGIIMLVIAWIAIDNTLVFEDEVEWVETMALEGEGYDKLVRRANGDKALNLKELSTMAEHANDYAMLMAGEKVLVPVMKEEK